MPHKDEKAARAYRAEYRRKHRAEYNAWKAQWRLEHPEQVAEAQRRHREKHRDDLAAMERDRAADPARKAYLKAYHQEWTKKRDLADPFFRRRKMLRDRYGLTLEEFDRMVAEQRGRCAICKTSEPNERNWNVDHCHASKQVRGLLCRDCNLGLGHFKDNSKSLARAIDYLKKHKA
jgi:Recombination endonuclease VII